MINWKSLPGTYRICRFPGESFRFPGEFSAGFPIGRLVGKVTRSPATCRCCVYRCPHSRGRTGTLAGKPTQISGKLVGNRRSTKINWETTPGTYRID